MRSRPPKYPSKPHPTGQARVRFEGRQVYLGVWGSPESHLAYQRLVDTWRKGKLEPARLEMAYSVADVLNLFLAAAVSSQRPTSKLEQCHFRHVLRAALESGLADRRAATVDAESLEIIRRRMLELGWSRRYARRQCVRFRTVWRWAERKHLVPNGSWEQLRTLQLGTGQAAVAVQPVPEADLAKTLAKMGPIPQAMARLQLLTGARPGEILALRPEHFRRQGGLLVADLGIEHKSGWRELQRLLYFGPKAQKILLPFLDRPASAHLFSPREAVAKPWASLNARYSIYSYEAAIRRACRRAGVPKWTPHRLRHNAASRLTAEFGAEVARVVLGHRDLAITRVYVRDEISAAARAMELAG